MILRKLATRSAVWTLIIALLFSSIYWAPIQSAFAEPTTAETLQNLGFEEGNATPDYWEALPEYGHEGDFVWDNAVKHSGAYSAKLTKTNNAGYLGLWGRSRASVDPNKDYTIEGYLKIDGATGGRTYIMVSQYKTDGTRVAANSYLFSELWGTNHDWEKVSYNFTTEVDTAYVSVTLTAQDGPITAWYDDLALVVTPVKEELQNLGFEEGNATPDYWEALPEYGHEGDFVWDNAVKHSGAYSAKLTKTNNAGYLGLWGRSRASVDPNKDYTIEGYLKIDGATGGRTYIMVSQYKTDGTRVAANSYLFSELWGTNHDWEKVSYNFTTEMDTAYVSVTLTAQDGPITAWYDDLALVVPSEKEELQNLGFEEGNATPDYWEALPEYGHEGDFVWDNTVKHSGTYSAKLTKTNNAGYLGLWGRSRASVDPNKDYTIEGYLKIDGATGGRTYIMVSQYKTDGTRVAANSYLFSELWGTNHDWKKVSYNFTTEMDTAYVSVTLTAQDGPITAWYDDLKLGAVPEDLNFDFETARLDEADQPLNWNLSNPYGAEVRMMLDRTNYAQGLQSVKIERSGKKGDAALVSAQKVPVVSGGQYHIQAAIKSKSAWSSKAQLNVTGYNTNGQEVGVFKGKLLPLNQVGDASEWAIIVNDYTAPEEVDHIRISLNLTQGNAIVWLDDIRIQAMDAESKMEEGFESVTESGLPLLWQKEVVTGNPVIDLAGGLNSEHSARIQRFAAGSEGYWLRELPNLMSGYTYKLSGKYRTSAATQALVGLQYLDWSYALSNPSRESRTYASSEEWTSFELTFMVPVGLNVTQLRLGAAGSAGEASFDDIDIKEIQQPPSKNPWKGNWVWYPESPYYDAVNQDRYFRQTIQLDDVPRSGLLQISADDIYELYINGHKVSEGSDWKSPKATDITGYLQAGANVIAAKVHNNTWAAGLLYDGTIILENGNKVALTSDSTIKASKRVDAGWELPVYDDQSWVPVLVIGRPPVAPWGNVSYDLSTLAEYSLDVQSFDMPSALIGGSTAQVKLKAKLHQNITKDFPLTLHLWKSNERYWSTTLQATSCDANPSVPMTSWPVNESITQCFTFNVPNYLPSGPYMIQLAPEALRLANVDNFLAEAPVLQSNAPVTTKSEIKSYKGKPTLFINGEMQSTMMYTPPENRMQLDPAYVSGMREAGVNQVAINVQLDEIWKETGMDYTHLDNQVIDALSGNPDADIMLKIFLNAGTWWENQHPDELVVQNNGDRGRVSFASDLWREDGGEALKDLIHYVNEAAYRDRIFGYQLMAGRTAEWLWWGGELEQAQDFSATSLRGFKAWLGERYAHDVAALRTAWNDASVTFDTVTVPTFAERQAASDQMLLNPATNRKVIDYHLFMAEMTTDSLLHFARVANASMDNRLIVGAYFGYLWNSTTYSANGTAHLYTTKALNSQDIDFMVGPANYGERDLGMASTFMSMVDSFAARGKMFIVEQDNRTVLNPPIHIPENDSGLGQTDTMEDTLNQLKRDFSNNLVKGAGMWWFDMGGGWFHDEAIYDAVTVMKEELTYAQNQSSETVSDVAVFVDESYYAYTGYDFWKTYSQFYALLNEQRYNLGTMGAPYDVYFMADLVSGLVPDHKINIMLSPFQLTEAERNAIDMRLKKDGKLIIWIYLPGITDGKKLDIELMEQLTGFNMAYVNELSSLEVKLDDSQPLNQGMQPTTYGALNLAGRATYSGPLAYVKDASATTLGTLTDRNETGLAYKDMGTWKSLYSSAPNLPNQLLANLIAMMDGHLYSADRNDVIFANNNYVMLHSLYGGNKTIGLPKTVDRIYDVFAGQYIATNASQIQFRLKNGESKLFRLETVAGTPGQGQPEEVTTEALREQLEAYIASGDVRGPLVNQLSNCLRQAQHHDSAGRTAQASKQLKDFLKQMNNPPKGQHIEADAKQTLEQMVRDLLAQWEE